MKAYFNGEEVVVLEFRNSEKYGPEARIVFTDGIRCWVPTDQIMIQ